MLSELRLSSFSDASLTLGKLTSGSMVKLQEFWIENLEEFWGPRISSGALSLFRLLTLEFLFYSRTDFFKLCLAWDSLEGSPLNSTPLL